MIFLKALKSGEKEDAGDFLLEGGGYGLWVSWSGKANAVLEQTLADYGGIRVGAAAEQALWFFFSVDVFLAAAKLDVWGKYNSMTVCIQIFESSLRCFADGRRELVAGPEIWEQSVEEPVDFKIYVHMAALPKDMALSGITLLPAARPHTFCAGDWRHIQADQRLPYKGTLSWFAVLRPVGSVTDKNFQIGWRDFYTKLEDVLQRNKLRFILNDYFLMMPLDSLREMRQWCRDYLNLVERCKADEKEGFYWPCVMAVTDRKKLHLNNDLPNSMGLDWSQLMPDFPYLSLRDGVLLGEGFQIYEVPFSQSRSGAGDWCNVSLAGAEAERIKSLPNLAIGALSRGEHKRCFYCGQHSHRSRECPSRELGQSGVEVWDAVAACGLESMKTAVAEINRRLAASPESLAELLGAEDETGVLTRAVFSVNTTTQLRGVPIFWKMRGRDLPKVIREPDLAEDGNPVWGVLRSFAGRDPDMLDKEMHSLQIRFPRDYRVFSLHGFVAVERDEPHKAEEYWRQAHALCLPGVAQSWHLFLLGRLAECQGRYFEAIAHYDKVLEAHRNWAEAEYRKLVCYVKSGFVGRIIPTVGLLLGKDPNFFNRMLLDPELERGHAAVFSILAVHWSSAETQIQEERTLLRGLMDELGKWFVEGSEFLEKNLQHINHVLSVTEIRNYVPYLRAMHGRERLERDFQLKVMNEIKGYKDVFSRYLERLAHIRDEAAWFPFPRLLMEFHRSYNDSAATLAWVMRNNMHVPEIFKKAQSLVKQEEERITAMEKRLLLLRVVRDSTLFSLIAAKKFFWMELAGLALVLLVFPLLLYYGSKSGALWIYDMMMKQQWAIQKVSIIIISALSAMIAVFWTILRFDQTREKLFNKAREEAEAHSVERAKKMEQRQQKLKLQKRLQTRERAVQARRG
ncbi:MAG: tetratricopeptide repeat protein [Deltaproteobacteria bacterium]|jgi:tetratricopeptide (TPR) repeat protein|nr:tetratricopeptide repeat protein [Deltaproteobacteria bacterium]